MHAFAPCDWISRRNADIEFNHSPLPPARSPPSDVWFANPQSPHGPIEVDGARADEKLVVLQHSTQQPPLPSMRPPPPAASLEPSGPGRGPHSGAGRCVALRKTSGWGTGDHAKGRRKTSSCHDPFGQHVAGYTNITDNTGPSSCVKPRRCVRIQRTSGCILHPILPSPWQEALVLHSPGPRGR